MVTQSRDALIVVEKGWCSKDGFHSKFRERVSTSDSLAIRVGQWAVSTGRKRGGIVQVSGTSLRSFQRRSNIHRPSANVPPPIGRNPAESFMNRVSLSLAIVRNYESVTLQNASLRFPKRKFIRIQLEPRVFFFYRCTF